MIVWQITHELLLQLQLLGLLLGFLHEFAVLGYPWLDLVETVDEVIACSVAAVQEVILAPRQTFTIDSPLLAVQLKDPREGLPLVSQLRIEANRTPSGLRNDMIHHVPLSVLDLHWLRRCLRDYNSSSSYYTALLHIVLFHLNVQSWVALLLAL